MCQQDRGCILGDLKSWPDFILVFGLQIAGIAQDCKIRPAAFLINGIDWFIHPLLETRRSGQGEMTACRKPDHADPLGVEAPLLCPTSNQADRPLGVEQWAERWFATNIPRTARHAILENDSSHAVR